MTKRKSDLLGLPFGTAFHRLRKQIMFDMARKLKMTRCYRCGEEIETVEQFSIEHKESWEKSADPTEAFFALENIAFSHHSCNSGAGVRHRRKITISEVYHLQWENRKNTQAWRDTVAKRREKRRLSREASTTVV